MIPSKYQIANSIKINQEWVEIHPDPPLVVSKQIQNISIEVPDLPKWDIRPESVSFIMPDGKAIKIEVELITQDGKTFKLEEIGLGPGLMFSNKPDITADSTASRLPQGMVFTTVRIRADRTLQGGQVLWICLTNY
ncbi:MAG: hypothetical protein CSA09_03560 [Candidatus Contendobacter odensis]|uniref:Uncharacterized protein n=1 Tax=Candidatus Contendibacter odensensis TaxID=1400860 RepID=A0A2G6PF10_9GAMM|nr:MAG: hypothetical protein CSA09_03560 [Candidatus Contendobacter odensis]